MRLEAPRMWPRSRLSAAVLSQAQRRKIDSSFEAAKGKLVTHPPLSLRRMCQGKHSMRGTTTAKLPGALHMTKLFIGY